jgi:hypothetical protein
METTTLKITLTGRIRIVQQADEDFFQKYIP